MATLTIATVTSDLSGRDGASTYNFGLDGVTYEIDLLQSEAEKLTASLERFTAAARRTGGRRAHPAPSANRTQVPAVDVSADQPEAPEQDAESVVLDADQPSTEPTVNESASPVEGAADDANVASTSEEGNTTPTSDDANVTSAGGNVNGGSRAKRRAKRGTLR